jgi:PKD repeat protein
MPVIAGFKYAWDFGDGHSSPVAEVSHVYAQPGTYTVTLLVTDTYGQTAQAATTITVDIGPPPPPPPVPPFTIQVGPNPATEGQPVACSLTGLPVDAPVPTPPEVMVVVPPALTIGQPGTFAAAITFGGDSGRSAQFQYDWQFGDGTNANTLRAMHAYSAAGTYTASLTVMDEAGLVGTDSKTVTVG